MQYSGLPCEPLCTLCSKIPILLKDRALKNRVPKFCLAQ
jgi:hypothetical protein